MTHGFMHYPMYVSYVTLNNNVQVLTALGAVNFMRL